MRCLRRSPRWVWRSVPEIRKVFQNQTVLQNTTVLQKLDSVTEIRQCYRNQTVSSRCCSARQCPVRDAGRCWPCGSQTWACLMVSWTVAQVALASSSPGNSLSGGEHLHVLGRYPPSAVLCFGIGHWPPCMASLTCHRQPPTEARIRPWNTLGLRANYSTAVSFPPPLPSRLHSTAVSLLPLPPRSTALSPHSPTPPLPPLCPPPVLAAPWERRLP